MEITQEFLDARTFLFSDLGDDADASVVCVQHLRFIPCRVCMYQEVSTVPYSCKPNDVQRVYIHQVAGR